jgi:hypothetical protein
VTQRFVWRNNQWCDARSNEPMPMPERDAPCCPRIHGDIAEYRSPIDGKLISSRSSRRYDLESNGCVEVDPTKKKRGYRNPSFARKHGLPLAEDVRDAVRK